MEDIDYSKVLDLSLSYHWYDEIASGRKKEEYREIKKFYCYRFSDYCKYMNFDASNTMFHWTAIPQCKLHHHMCYGNHVYAKTYDAVRFHRGQGSKTTMLIECLGIEIGKGRPEWGAPTDEEVFIIKLGKIIYNYDQ